MGMAAGPVDEEGAGDQVTRCKPGGTNLKPEKRRMAW